MFFLTSYAIYFFDEGVLIDTCYGSATVRYTIMNNGANRNIIFFSEPSYRETIVYNSTYIFEKLLKGTYPCIHYRTYS